MCYRTFPFEIGCLDVKKSHYHDLLYMKLDGIPLNLLYKSINEPEVSAKGIPLNWHGYRMEPPGWFSDPWDEENNPLQKRVINPFLTRRLQHTLMTCLMGNEWLFNKGPSGLLKTKHFAISWQFFRVFSFARRLQASFQVQNLFSGIRGGCFYSALTRGPLIPCQLKISFGKNRAAEIPDLDIVRE